MAKIKDLPLDSRPREKALALGLESLSDIELLALVIGSGVPGQSAIEIAESLIAEYQGVNGLSNAPWISISQTKGLSDIKSLTIAASFELGRRVKVRTEIANALIDAPASVFKRYRGQMENESRESLILMLFNKRMRLIKEKKMYVGTAENIVVSSREIVAEALINNASSLLIVHNHPKGIPLPSVPDVRMTQELQKMCLELGVKLRDHVIIGASSYYSFKENKII